MKNIYWLVPTLLLLQACNETEAPVENNNGASDNNNVSETLPTNSNTDPEAEIEYPYPTKVTELGIQTSSHWDQQNRKYNLEAIIPPQCYTRTEGQYNPCYTCHQSYEPFYGEGSRPNDMRDGELQEEYAFSDVALTNHWKNLFVDRSDDIAKISDAQITQYVESENYTALKGYLERTGFSGYIPDIANYHLAEEAFDEHGFALDGSQWVAFNYKPLPSTFWPTNGSTDDVLIRLPACFREDSNGLENRDIYTANLGLVEIALQDLDETSIPEVDENRIGLDIDGDGILTTTDRIKRRAYYLCSAREDIALQPMLYPTGTEFLHSVRYVGVDEKGEIYPAPRMKEVRYMKKTRFFNHPELRSIYGNERMEKEEGLLPQYANNGDDGLNNGIGWVLSGFIEGQRGELRPQTLEETTFCMGCHSSIGSTIDQTFAFARKVSGKDGWGYINLKGMPDSPNVGETEGEILTYLSRVGGGDEFRQNDEMQKRWFADDGSVDRAKVAGKDVYQLITPSRERALALNKAYQVIVKNQSFLYGRDATIKPTTNVYFSIDPDNAPTLPEEHRHSWDIRLDWNR